MMSTNFRYEFKYVFDDHVAAIVQRYLEKVGLQRSMVQDGGYTVTSLYFDTLTLTDYHEKIEGLKHRKKLRARIYRNKFDESPNDVWLEVKEKHDMNILKLRGRLPYPTWCAFLAGGNLSAVATVCKKDKALTRFFYLFLRGGYRPFVVVRYQRIVFEASFLSDIRVTLDSQIEGCKWKDFVNNRPTLAVEKGRTVLEIKFREGLPWWFKEMIRRFNLSRQPFSKYTTTVNAINRHHPIPR